MWGIDAFEMNEVRYILMTAQIYTFEHKTKHKSK